MKTDHSQNIVQIEEEKAAFAEHFNTVLKDVEYVAHKLPISPQNLIDSVSDGLVLAGVINYIKPNTIVSSSLIKIDDADDKDPNAEKKRIFNITANVNKVMEGTKSIGLRLVNIGSNDIIEGNENMILAFIWQLIRHHVLISVNLKAHPQLIRLLNPGEGIDVLLSMKPEQILLRWFNYHLGRDNSSLSVANFGADVCDGKAFLALMRQVSPKNFDEEKSSKVGNDSERVALVMETADKMKSRCFATAKTILGKTYKLNLAFTATLFNNYIGIHLPSEDEIREMLKRIEELEETVERLERNLIVATENQEEAAKLREQDLLSQIDVLKVELVREKAKLDRFKKDSNIREEEMASLILSALESENNDKNANQENSMEGKKYDSDFSKLLNHLINAYKMEKERTVALMSSLQKTKDINDLISTKIVEVSEELIKYRNPPNVLRKKNSKGCL